MNTIILTDYDNEAGENTSKHVCTGNPGTKQFHGLLTARLCAFYLELSRRARVILCRYAFTQ